MRKKLQKETESFQRQIDKYNSNYFKEKELRKKKEEEEYARDLEEAEEYEEQLKRYALGK